MLSPQSSCGGSCCLFPGCSSCDTSASTSLRLCGCRSRDRGLRQPRARSVPAAQKWPSPGRLAALVSAPSRSVHNVPAVDHVLRNLLIKTNYISQRADSSSLPSALSHTPVAGPPCEAVAGKVLHVRLFILLQGGVVGIGTYCWCSRPWYQTPTSLRSIPLCGCCHSRQLCCFF